MNTGHWAWQASTRPSVRERRRRRMCRQLVHLRRGDRSAKSGGDVGPAGLLKDVVLRYCLLRETLTDGDKELLGSAMEESTSLLLARHTTPVT